MTTGPDQFIAQVVAAMSTLLLREMLEDTIKIRDFAQALQHNDARTIALLDVGIAAMEAELKRRFPPGAA
jgi:hypothetical protein